ncbi:MAG TPA: nitrous oxide reductase accessory protein NosL, partial [Beijerinckiaceae bacterium]|nr:nitrous oxide reductase accessory protein NosL [Beijerinckiaceae bacterium]
MRRIAFISTVAAALALAACNDTKTAQTPPPHELTTTAIGHYCGMNLMEHAGPKAQIILASRREPIWFSSARDAFSFTLLPEEPRDISAIYVSDMGRAASWEEPGTTNWVEAKRAAFVIGSNKKGGMGADETVPFADQAAAHKFAAENGGRVVGFSEVPREYVLGGGEATSSVDAAATGKHDH